MKRIFVSSTFRDMQHERDLFHTVITPKLNGYARSYGESVSFCDLRWGVNTGELDSESGSNKVLSVCLDEIDRCDKTGSMPYIVVLLGDRYGWIPDASLIKSAAKKKQFDIDDMERSVTALEIEYGALRDSAHLSRTLFYFREFEEALPKDSKYAVEGDTDEARERFEERLTALKNKIRKMAGDRVKTYRVKLADDGETVLGLDAFSDMVTKDICRLMEKDWQKYAALSPHERLARSQWNLAEQKASQFGAREDVVYDIVEELHNGRNLMAIQGESGSGKSTLISRLAYELKKQRFDVIPIYCGSQTELGDSMDVLRYIVYELEYRQNLSHMDDEAPKDGIDNEKSIPLDAWRQRLASLTDSYEGNNLVILIDALDQLFADKLRDQLVFLPAKLNKRIKIILSCLTEYPLEQALTIGYYSIRLDALTKREIIVSVKSILKYLGRELEKCVIDEMAAKPESTNPLYLSLLIQRLVMMDKRDFDDIHTHGDDDTARAEHKISVIHNISDTVEGACFDIVNEASARIGGNFVRPAIEYIALSQSGLRESDLAAILQEQGVEWNALDFSILTNYLQGFFLTREDGRIDFTHRTIRDGIVLHCENAVKKHQNLRNHLHTLKRLDPVKIDETVYQCYRADDKDYFVRYVEDIVEDDFGIGIRAAAKSLSDIIGKNGYEWINAILDKSDLEKLENGFYKFLYLYLRPHFLHSNDRYNAIIAILQKATVRFTKSMDHTSPEDIALIGEINYYLGDCFSTLSKFALSEQYFTEAIRFYGLLRDRSDISIDGKLARVYNAYGLMLNSIAEYEKSERYIKLGLQLREKEGECSEALGVSYHNMASHCYDSGAFEDALSYEQKAIEIIEKCALENERECAENLITFYRRFSLINQALGKQSQSVDYIDRAIHIASKYAALFPEEFEIGLGYSYNDKGVVLEKNAKDPVVIECYQKAIAIFERYTKKFPEKYEETLATMYCNLGGEYEKSADTYELSEKSYVRGIKIKERIYSLNPSAIGMSLAVSYNNLGILYLNQNKNGEARHYFLLAISIAQKSSAEEMYINKRNLQLFYANAALTYKKMLMPLKAERYTLRAKEIEKCGSLEEMKRIYSQGSKHRFRLKTDDTSHVLIKINGFVNVFFIAYMISMQDRAQPNLAFFGMFLLTLIFMGFLSGIVASREVRLEKRQTSILWGSCLLSLGLVTEWYVLYVISKSRKNRTCGEKLTVIKRVEVEQTETQNSEEIQKKINRLLCENEMLEKRLSLVRDEKYIAKRKKLLVFGIAVGFLTIILCLFCIEGVMRYISFISDPENDFFFAHANNYLREELERSNGKYSFILAVALLPPLAIANGILAVLNIRNVWALNKAKKFVLIGISVLSLGTLTGLASFHLYYRETNVMQPNSLTRGLLTLHMPVARLFKRKSTASVSNRKFENSIELKIYNNTEKINKYQLELMKLTYEQKNDENGKV